MAPYVLLALNLLSLRHVPAGTELHVRLATPIGSYASKPGDKVTAVLIAPVTIEGAPVLPAGSVLAGTVRLAQAVGYGIAHETASLAVDFDSCILPGGDQLSVATRLLEVDNGRERVVENGLIRGVRTTGSIAYRATGYIRIALGWELHAQLALWAAKLLVVQVPEPEIYYPAGVELTLNLRDGLVGMAAPDSEERLTDQDRENLRLITAGMPYRAYVPGSNRASDLMNLLLAGTRSEIEDAFTAAGWTHPAVRTLRSKIAGVRAVMEDRSDRTLPVSRMLADDRDPDMSWEKGLNDVAKRHHVRIWRQNATWNGKPLWIAAATRDVDFAFLRRGGGALTHRIEEDVDQERDKIANDLEFTSCTDLVDWWDRPGAPISARNATGDLMVTDGEMAVIRLNRCAAPRAVSADSEPLPSRPNFAKRLLRREILSFRSDVYRTNTYWRSYEAARWMLAAIRHRHHSTAEKETLRVEKSGSAEDGFLTRARNSSWLR